MAIKVKFMPSFIVAYIAIKGQLSCIMDSPMNNEVFLKLVL